MSQENKKDLRVGKFIIHGNPIPKLRPRFGDGRCYDAQKQQKLIAGITLQSQHNGIFFSGPLKMKIDFFLPFGQSRKISLDGKFHIFTPDLSNLVKFIEDVANGILYKDDCIIASLIAAKWFSKNPRTEITVMEIHDPTSLE